MSLPGSRSGEYRPADSDSDSHDPVEFVGDITDYWSYTQVRDWVLLQPDLTRTALHLYLLLRSMVSETARRAGGGLRRMSIDQLCWLLPGVNGKPASTTMVKDALRLLGTHGLVENPEGDRLISSTGKGAIQNTLRRYQVNDLPPDVHTGWRNVWDKLDAYAPNWRQTPPHPPTHVRTEAGTQRTPGRISDHRNDQERNAISPGRFDGRKSVPPGRISDQAGRISGEDASLTCGNASPKEASPRSLSLSGSARCPEGGISLPEGLEERERSASPMKRPPAPPAAASVGAGSQGAEVPAPTPAPAAGDGSAAVVEAFASGWRAAHGVRPGRAQLAAVAAAAVDALESGDERGWLVERVVPFMVRRRYLDLALARTHPECPASSRAADPAAKAAAVAAARARYVGVDL